ncbi:hypothetical protein [Pseudolabrys sp.]|uniref:hypothetical protein n=1 Tax=Pseudolabrys sp. TaxID=1960880 RepID=UPI003D0CCC86
MTPLDDLDEDQELCRFGLPDEMFFPAKGDVVSVWISRPEPGYVAQFWKSGGEIGVHVGRDKGRKLQKIARAEIPHQATVLYADSPLQALAIMRYMIGGLKAGRKIKAPTR